MNKEYFKPQIPLLSIAIPTWNRPDSLIALVRSIGYVSNPEIEIVISDDGSDYENFKKVETFASNYSNILLHRNKSNIGMVANWNKSISLARGYWICLICDDDFFYPNALDRILEIIKCAQEPMLIIQSPGLNDFQEKLPSGIESVRKINLPMVSGNFWSRKITDTLGGFDERLKYSPDAEFWYRICNVYPVLRVKNPFAHYIAHDNNYAFTTWMQDDFLDQVHLLSEINSKYFQINDEISYLDNGINSTINTILNATFLVKGKKPIFNKYYKIGLKLNYKSGNCLNFITNTNKMLIKIFLNRLKQKFLFLFKKKFKHNSNFKKLPSNRSFDWNWDLIPFNRIALVNLLCANKLDGNYLEIGCQGNSLFNAVYILNKIGVDPVLGGTHRMYSDDFFKSNTKRFDVIFIDGLHEYEQVHRDVQNAIFSLNDGGWIAIHDMLPHNAIEEHVPNVSPGPWCGDVWKVAFELIKTPGIDFKLVKIDCGIGIFRLTGRNVLLSDLSNQLKNLRFDYLYDRINELPLIDYHDAFYWIKKSLH